MEWALIVGRLRFATKVAARPADFSVALLQSECGADWRAAVQAACCALLQLMPHKLGRMPDTQVMPAAWERLWQLYPAQ